MLVGMAKNSALYNPKRFPDIALRRRNTVLHQMEKYGYISKEVYDSLRALPLELDFQRLSHNVGLATYFREYLRKTMSAKEPQRKNYSKWNYAKYREDSVRWIHDPLYGWCNKNPTGIHMIYIRTDSGYIPPLIQGCRHMQKMPLPGIWVKNYNPHFLKRRKVVNMLRFRAT